MYISIIDTTLRDGIQHEEQYISLEKRIEIVNMLIDAGIKRLEVSSFAHPIHIPQFREAEEFAMMLPRRDGVEYTFLALNRKAAERAVAAKAKGAPIDRVLTGPLATSAAYALKNMKRSHEELFADAKENLQLLHAGGIECVCGNVGTVFGCPIAGEMPLERAYEFTERLFDMGFDEVEHADTSGSATPERVSEYFEHVMKIMPDSMKHTFHIHDIKGNGIECYYAACRQGITQFECTLGGIGGQPANRLDGEKVSGTGDYYYTSGRTGLVDLEDFVSFMDDKAELKGINIDAAISAGIRMEQILGRKLDSLAVAKALGRTNGSERQ